MAAHDSGVGLVLVVLSRRLLLVMAGARGWLKWIVGTWGGMASRRLVVDGWRVGVWSVALGGDRCLRMPWLTEMGEMEEFFFGVGMVGVVFPRRKIWSLVLGRLEKRRGRWRPRCDVIRRFRPPWSGFDRDFLTLWV